MRTVSSIGIAALLAASCTDSAPTLVTTIIAVPESVTVEPGEQRLIVAVALDPDGRQVVGATVAFSSLDTSVASVSVSGLVTGRSPGRTAARAQALAIVHDVPIIVPNPTRSIEVQPDSVVVDEGGTQLLTAVALDAFGRQIANTVITFSAGDTGIASITPGGLLRGKRAGRTTATAARGAVSRTVPVTVNPFFRASVITTVPLPSSAFALGISSAGVAYVGRDDAKLTRFDVAHYSVSGEVTASLPPVDIAFEPSGAKAYVTNSGASSFSVVDVATDTIGSPVGLSDQPLRVRVSPDGAKLYVTLTYGAVVVLHRATLATDTTIALDVNPNGIAFDPTKPSLYVSTMAGYVTEISTTTRKTVRRLAIGGTPQDIVVSPDGTEIYIANESRNRIDIYNLVSGNAVTTIALPAPPFAMIASPDGALLFVTLPNLGVVDVIDPKLRKVVRTITTNGTPRRIAIDPNGGTLIVTNLDAWVDFIH